MSQINLQVNAIAFADNQPSNNPLLRHFDLTYKLYGISSKSPIQQPSQIAPGESRVILDGSRVNSIDSSTAFDVSVPDPSQPSIYRFTMSDNTSPAFRTDRLIGIDTTTQFNMTVNGPVATFTSTAGPFNTANIVVGDILRIENGAGNSASNWGRFVIIAKTSNSVSVSNLNAAAESFTILVPSKFLIYSNGGGSSNQAQIGDKVSISAGFSLATQGVYDLVDVTPNWFQVAIGNPGGIPIETSIQPGPTGIVIYSAAKKFALIAAQDKVSVRFNADTSDNTIIEAVEADNAEKPGLLVKNGPFYKLVITNLGVNPVTVTVATGD